MPEGEDMSRPIVQKFGGTSMGTDQALTAVAGIIRNVDGGNVAVVSATSGTTDMLIRLGKEAVSDGDFEATFAELVQKHEKIVANLHINPDMSGFWEEMRKILQGINMLGELSPNVLDRLQSFGERISATILADYLKADGIEALMVDAFNLVKTDNNFGAGNVDFDVTYKKTRETLLPLIEKGIVPVVTGFIGQAENGQYITLGRGGSDYSGAIVAGALGASELQIWTDVDGILNTDPRLVPEAKVLPQVSFNEAGELAYFGAKVLHPKTIKPAIEKNIPVRILNTFNVAAPGTLITNEEIESIKSVTYKKNISVINICSLGMLNAHGFLAKIFDAFARHKVVADVVSTSEVSVSVTVDTVVSQPLIEELRSFATVKVYGDMAIICLVGEGIRAKSGILGQLFSAVNEHNVSMVSQGASKRNITFLVNGEEAPDVVVKVFNTFFK
ncbi:aspartate kinase [Candidatus Peregrinibacteria bacterium]|nr:aspartate kinase [Candidatus Peregrinibacteria bacterium]